MEFFNNPQIQIAFQLLLAALLLIIILAGLRSFEEKVTRESDQER